MKDIKKSLKVQGFTLIELIVIIAILAVLAVIAVPRLVGYQEEPERVQTVTMPAL